MKKMTFAIESRLKKTRTSLAKDFISSIIYLNNISNISLVHMEIFIDDFTQVVVEKTKNLENVCIDNFHGLFKSDSYFVLGDRKRISVTYDGDEAEVVIYYNFEDIVIPNMGGVRLISTKGETEMSEFEVLKSHLR